MTRLSVPIDWEMYAKYDEKDCIIARPGDNFLTDQMSALQDAILSGEVTRATLLDAVRLAQKRCKDAGFIEVHDTEPEFAITDFVNRMCDIQGWQHVSRWDL